MTRFRRTFRRRRRPGATMMPFSVCSQPIVPLNNELCTTPTVDMFLLGALHGDELPTSFNASDIALQSLRKGLLVQSLRFHWAYYATTPLGGSTSFAYSIRCAIVRMEYDPASFTPTFLPNLFLQDDTGLGDVLWRGAAILRQPGTDNVEDGISTDTHAIIVGSMSREGSHSPPEHVKAKRRLDKNQGLFWVTNIHNPTVNEQPAIGLDIFGVAAVRSYQR